MDITQETVEHVAKLARLDLTPDETERYRQELSKILSLIDQLNALDLSQSDLTLDTEQPTVYREDMPTRDFDPQKLLSQAPSEEDGFFRVPRILE